MTFTSNIIALHPVARCRMPELIPDGVDKVIERRRAAGDMADHARLNTQHSFTIVRRQEEFAHRMNDIVLRRAQA